MNLSRAYTLTSGTLFSVGRVQTPTLALIIARDREIDAFVPEPYLEVQATFEGQGGSYRGTFYDIAPAVLFDERGALKAFKPLSARLPADGVLARQVAERAKLGEASVLAIDRSLRRTPPPPLYDLTELQRHANRLYGYSAKHTLDAAQRLYEVHKALSYPRTDSRHLSSAVAGTLAPVVAAIAPRYPGLVAADSGERRLSKRFVDDAKVGDHHALIPTAQAPRELAPGSAEARIYDLVCRRLLMAWHTELVEAVTRLVTEVLTHSARDLYATQGTSVESPGWNVLDPRPVRRAPDEPPKIPAGLEAGEPQRVSDVVVHRKQTSPPSRFTEATLLTAMETAGKTLDDRALIDAMRDSGLGTPATRAATIETLLARGYITREAKNLRGTPLGAALVAAVHPLVRSAEMTGRWELRLRRMERGQEALEPFMRDIAAYVREVVGAEAEKPAAPRQRMAADESRRKRGSRKSSGGWKRRKKSAPRKKRGTARSR
jgi:DNA topoisomerase-3